MYKKFSILLIILAMIMVGSMVAYSSESWIGADGKVQTDYRDPTEIVGQPNQIPTKMESTSIVVDGDPSDWVGIAPLITDPLGNFSPGLDFINLSVTDDGTYVYFLYEFDSAPVNCSYLMLDTDQNPTTGCAVYGMGIEYGIAFCPGWGIGYIGDGRDCSWSDDFSGALIWAFANQYIEAAVPISTLEILTPELTEFDITTANDTSYIATYVLEVIDVPVDIKPQSCPNPLNVNSQGVLPVAILGTADFDVTQVDIASVRLEGIDPIRSSFEDVATPFEPFTSKEDCSLDCTEEGPDGHMDLTLKFYTQEVVEVLGEVSDGDCLVLKLMGVQYDGTSIEGEDVVVILKKGKK